MRVRLLLLLLLFLLGTTLRAQAAQVPVRFSEGMTRGFLVLNDSAGKRPASGDFLQVENGEEVKARVLLHFKDGSLHDETAVFTQHKLFSLQSYRLIQKGPSFPVGMDITVDCAKGSYRIKTTERKNGREKELTGKLDLPPDVYNGMVPTVVKNLPKGASEKIHMIAFTPAPRVIELDISPTGEVPVTIGDLKRAAEHYVLKARLGWLKIPAALTGRTPPDDHIWTIASDVPAFLKFEGPLYTDGPIWRIELTSPVWGK
ncbi:hypothetical protein L4X63_12575 [Geomonas sp. Red32]|uniref:hypothetical protein n=1 Tax=Geomonas sp. Red32 TaxID=2912856 RepID=UPI00202CBCAB|nr:hypothetical protein [Geomonas sp. Red32]MCM0082425.1 hypothetical protein [Geomonas sp. Red32]